MATRFPIGKLLGAIGLGGALLLGTACVLDTGEPSLGGDEMSDDGEDGDEYDPYDAAGKADGLGDVGGPVKFAAACDAGDRLTIAAVGDVLLHGPLQKQAYASDGRFRSLWSSVEDVLGAADVTYANLEGPTAPGVNGSGQAVTDPGPTFDGVVYSSYPMFNYHPSLIDDLRTSGVDVVSTANNHSLDRRALGIDRTVDELRARGLAFTGTRKRNETWQRYVLTEHKGFRLAWLACTFSTNGVSDSADQVTSCYAERQELLSLVTELSGRNDVDAVIVTPHWGEEYSANPASQEIKLAHDFLDAGATAVLGSHPHVLQPWQKYVTRDGRETVVIYSLGNFVSNQSQLARRSTLAMRLGLTRRSDGSVVVNGVRYVPLHMTHHANGWLSLEALDRTGGNGDSRKLTVSMFGLWNLDLPTLPADTSPQCDADWEPAHPLDGWIGGSCESSGVCGGAQCSTSFPDGLCTQSCEGSCPDQVGRATTFCVAAPSGAAGMCVAQCQTDADCRTGWSCQSRSRYGDASTTRRVCVAL